MADSVTLWEYLTATVWFIIKQCLTQPLAVYCVPVGGTDESEGNELVPERVILWYGLCAHQGLEAGVIGQVTDLASVGTHLYCCPSAKSTNLHCFSTRHMINPVGRRYVLIIGVDQLTALNMQSRSGPHAFLSIHLNRSIIKRSNGLQVKCQSLPSWKQAITIAKINIISLMST